MVTIPSRTRFGLALVVVAAGVALLAWRFSPQGGPEPVSPELLIGPNPVADGASGRVDPLGHQGVTDEVSRQTASVAPVATGEPEPDSDRGPAASLSGVHPQQVLTLDPGAVPASDLVALLVRKFDRQDRGSVSAYHAKQGEGRGGLPWVELSDDHFPPDGAEPATGGEPTATRGMLGTEDWRPGYLTTQRSDLVGYVRVPNRRRDLMDPVPVEWVGSGALNVEWIEEIPLGRDMVHVVRTDPPSPLLAAASARLPCPPLAQEIRIKGKGPTRVADPVALLEGNYTWRTRGGGPGLEGTLTIVQGEELTLRIKPPRPITFVASLIVDATGALDADLSRSEALLFHSNRPTEQQRPLPFQLSGQAGIWTTEDFEVSAADGDGWQILLTPLMGFEWSHFTVPVTEDEPVVRVTLTDAGDPFEVRVTVLGNDTGKAPAEVSIRQGRGLETRRVRRSNGGQFAFEASGSRPLDLFVAADGYRTLHLIWTRGTSPEDLEVRLEPGFRERVLAFDVRTMMPVEGVPVRLGDRLVGKTDKDGVLWLSERAPMLRPTIDPSWTTIHASPAGANEVDGKEHLSTEPTGWFFAVEPPKEGR